MIRLRFTRFARFAAAGHKPLDMNLEMGVSQCQLFRVRVPHGVEAATRSSGSHIASQPSIADCLLAPYLSIYTLVALIRYIDRNAIH